MNHKGMKFDLVLGNPPYQENTDSDKGNKQGNFWMKFLLKGFDLLSEDGTIAMVIQLRGRVLAVIKRMRSN